MTESLRPDAADVLARAGHHWGWLMAFGVITLLAGIVALAWPGPALIVFRRRHAGTRTTAHAM
jgi:uncharacterized membrane protein HdeD (DUF308 family)